MVYDTLQDLQGSGIPKSYGCFTINFSDREYAEDQNVPIILVDDYVSKATPLRPDLSLTQEVKGLLAQSIRSINFIMFRRGLLWPNVDASNYMLSQGDKTIICVDFSTVHHVSECVSNIPPDDNYEFQVLEVEELLRSMGMSP
jgi:hypothetical protein